MANERDVAFSLDDRAGWSGFLAEHGYAIVRGAVAPEAARAALDDLWALMEALGQVRRDRPASWRASASWPPMLHGGMIQYLGHTAVQWRMRELCAGVFARYYGVELDQLATSFDGLCMMHGDRRYQERDLVSFLHTDQSPLRLAEWSIQGLVNLADGGPDDGGLVVVPGSHREHQAFFLDHPSGRQESDWYLFTPEERTRYRARARKVCAEPGDFLLWDSRTFHCNTVPTRPGAVRACVYACMLPHDRVPAGVRRKRAAAWRDRRVSSHHPGDGFRLFPALPRFVRDRDAFYAKVLALQPAGEPSALERSLVCGE